MRRIVCYDCGSELKPEMEHCQECGSKNRIIKSKIEERPDIKEKIHIKEKKAGKKKPTRESIYGDEISKATGKWIDKKRIIDRKNDRYIETITDPETGEIIHHCDEKLSEHTGHGSAKTAKASKETERG